MSGDFPLISEHSGPGDFSRARCPEKACNFQLDWLRG